MVAEEDRTRRLDAILAEASPASADLVRLSTTHISASGAVKAEFSSHGVTSGVLEQFRSFGKSVISLFCYQRVCNAGVTKSVGQASLAAELLKGDYYSGIGKFLQSRSCARFGEGVTESERQSERIWTDLSSQFVGALSHECGISAAFSFIQSLGVSVSNQILAPGKDPKTQLQEYFQGRRKRAPTYEFIEQQGPQHALEFRVAVKSPDGRTALGAGKSKRLASVNAAANFIEAFLPSLREKREPATYNDSRVWVWNAEEMPHTNAIRKLGEEYSVGVKELNYLSLALVHRSYQPGSSFKTPYGVNNTLLAFLGSAALHWGVHDLALKRYRGIVKQGLPAPHLPILLAYVIPEQSISDCFDAIGLDLALLVGAGQKTEINRGIRAESVQALVGALFLLRRDTLRHGEDLFVEGSPLCSWIFAKLRVAFEMSPGELLPAKTRFQETCQAIGLGLRYDSKLLHVDNKKVTVIPRVHLLQGGSSQLSYHLPKVAADSLAMVEAELATMLLRAFRKSQGIEPALGGKDVGAEEFFLRHTLQLVGNVDNELAWTVRSQRMLRVAALGTGLLAAEKYSAFAQWVAESEKLLARSILSPELVRFYRLSGASSGGESVDLRSARELLERLRNEFANLDPATYTSDVRAKAVFQDISSLARIFRMKGDGKESRKTVDILEDIAIALRRRCGTIRVGDVDDSALLTLERPGETVELVDEIVRELLKYVPSTSVEVSLSSKRHAIRIQLHWAEGKVSANDILKALTQSALFTFLSTDLFVTSAIVDKNTIEFVLRARAPESKSQTADTLIEAFLDVGSLSRELYQTIASWLHDMKNELVGFQVSINNANSTHVRSERYRLNYLASRHIEKAEELAKSIELITGASAPALIGEMDLQAFFRGIVEEVLSWAPPSVVVIPPENEDASVVKSDWAMLRVVFVNLCKNSIEAMPQGGKLTLEWVYDREREILEVEINDSAGAMDHAACEKLNKGELLRSDKPSGSGVGLLTVMLMLRRLGGAATFSTEPGRRTRVNLEIPTVSEPLIMDDAASTALA